MCLRCCRLVAHSDTSLELLKFDHEHNHRYHCTHQGSPFVHHENEDMTHSNDHNRRYISAPVKERPRSSARISPLRPAWPEKTTFDQTSQKHTSPSRDQDFDGRFSFFPSSVGSSNWHIYCKAYRMSRLTQPLMSKALTRAGYIAGVDDYCVCLCLQTKVDLLAGSCLPGPLSHRGSIPSWIILRFMNLIFGTCILYPKFLMV